MFYKKVQSLCKEHSTTITGLLKALEMSSSNGNKWRDGKIPKSATVQKIADYFKVSTDYLLSDTNFNQPLSENETVMLTLFKDLDQNSQIKFLGRLEDSVCNDLEYLRVAKRLKDACIPIEAINEFMLNYQSQKDYT